MKQVKLTTKQKRDRRWKVKRRKIRKQKYGIGDSASMKSRHQPNDVNLKRNGEPRTAILWHPTKQAT